MRIIFMGTPDFAVPTLQTLINSRHNIVAVYSQPPRPKGRGLKLTPSSVHQLAEKHQLQVRTPISLKSAEAQQEFANLHADIAVVVAYGLLLPKAILTGTKHGCVNIHPSALPRFRGAAPIQRTIMAGDPYTEICIMQMNEGLDTGDVILRKVHIIEPGTTAGALHDALSVEAPALLMQALDEIENGSAVRFPQVEDGVTYAAKISKEEAKLDFSEPAKIVLQKILGLSPFPGAYFEQNGERIKVLDASLEKGPFSLNCKDGAVYPTVLQRAGGKRMGVDEFLAGFKP